MYSYRQGFAHTSAIVTWKVGGAALAFTLILLVLPRPTTAATPAPPPDFKVAFIGDQGVGGRPVAVLELIRNEGADMVLHQGDFGYTLNAAAWDQQVDDTLGADFPYFGAIGNHDCLISLPGCSGPGDWPDYQALLQARLDRIPGAICTGELGVNAACSYMGIFFILSGVGTLGTDHKAFVTNALNTTNSNWRICTWHKNHQLMQVGGKVTEVPMSMYDACRAGGAIIATAHEHSYSRTHLMSSFANQTILDTSAELSIGEGQTIAFVSGLGGLSVRAENATRAADPWWASIHTSTQGAQSGALFCSFNHQSAPNRAHCYFKDLGGVVADEFDLVSLNAQTPAGVPATSELGLAILVVALLTSAFLARRERHVAPHPHEAIAHAGICSGYPDEPMRLS